MPPIPSCQCGVFGFCSVNAQVISFFDISCSYLHPFHFCMHIGLPDAASIEASKMVDADNDRTVLIDASTAFRVNDEWTYGFPGKH